MVKLSMLVSEFRAQCTPSAESTDPRMPARKLFLRFSSERKGSFFHSLAYWRISLTRIEVAPLLRNSVTWSSMDYVCSRRVLRREIAVLQPFRGFRFWIFRLY